LSRPFHGGNLTWAAAIAGCPVSSIVDFSASINPLGPPASAIAAIQAALEAIKGYPDPDYYSLRTALAELNYLSSDLILLGNGSAELLTWASRELSQREVTYLLTPAFGDYGRALKTFGAKVQGCLLDLETGAGKRDAERNCQGKTRVFESGLELLDLIANSQLAQAGLLLNNPHNPTGKLFSRQKILPYLERFDLVVVDEAFMDFLPPEAQESLVSVVEEYPNLVILRSLTKFYSLPGLRLGYAIAHPDRLRRWQQWRDPWPVNVLAALAGEAAIQDKTFAQQTWDWLLPAREHLLQGLASLPGLYPLESAANFLLVRTDCPGSQLQANLLKEHHLLIRDCLSFPELGDRYFRVAIRSPADNQRLLDALYQVYLTINP
jgi:L-threonine-O-3-phosphate decarboxylase